MWVYEWTFATQIRSDSAAAFQLKWDNVEPRSDCYSSRSFFSLLSLLFLKPSLCPLCCQSVPLQFCVFFGFYIFLQLFVMWQENWLVRVQLSDKLWQPLHTNLVQHGLNIHSGRLVCGVVRVIVRRLLIVFPKVNSSPHGAVPRQRWPCMRGRAGTQFINITWFTMETLAVHPSGSKGGRFSCQSYI